MAMAMLRPTIVAALSAATFLILSASPISLINIESIFFPNTVKGIGSGPYHSAEALPESFQDSEFVDGLNTPTAMEFSSDGRLFVTEKSGKVMVIKNGELLDTPFVSVSVNSNGERGLLGIAFDPNFATNRYVYIYYTTSTSPIHNRVSRVFADPANPDRALVGSEVTILDLENLSSSANHNGGAMHFGKDGKLYIGVGENANSANAQSLSTRLGKILRINPDGSIPSDNPFYNTAGAKKEIWALGLRNPFSFAFSPAPASTLVYINDVGANAWEEINLGAKGANYGWPTCEGTCSNPSFVKPIYTYSHTGGGRAIAGGAFYESSQFPSEYKGSYFFGDYVAGFIKRLTPSNQVVDFLSSVPTPVDIKIGPDGSLYYLSIGNGEVHKVEYLSGGNSNPVAVATASPMSGSAPLTITFDGSESSDPDSGDVLSYSWNFGDGSPVATGVSKTHTYNNAGQYVAELTVSDSSGETDVDSINIAAGNPPVGTISTPVFNTKYNAGTIISFTGSASDTEDGALPASAFSWKILFHHNTHTHPFQEFNGVKSGSFTIPRIGESSDDVWYRIYLTTTDSSGLTHLSTRDILPNKSTLTLSSSVPGLQVYLDGQPQTTPYSFVGVVGFTRTLQAPVQQNMGGETYQFQSWSDGGAATHTINTPSSNTQYIANYATTTVDTTRPTVTITSPSTGSSIAGPSTGVKVSLTGSAADSGSGVQQVEVKTLKSGVPVHSYQLALPNTPGTWAAWSHTLTFTQTGTYTITARATDNDGNQNWYSMTVTISFGADRTLPTVAITFPPSGSSFAGPAGSPLSVNLAGLAADSGGGVQKVELKSLKSGVLVHAYQLATPASSDNWSKWTHTMNFSQAGTYTVTARVTDRTGNQYWYTITLNVSLIQ